MATMRQEQEILLIVINPTQETANNALISGNTEEHKLDCDLCGIFSQ